MNQQVRAPAPAGTTVAAIPIPSPLPETGRVRSQQAISRKETQTQKQTDDGRDASRGARTLAHVLARG